MDWSDISKNKRLTNPGYKIYLVSTGILYQDIGQISVFLRVPNPVQLYAMNSFSFFLRRLLMC